MDYMHSLLHPEDYPAALRRYAELCEHVSNAELPGKMPRLWQRRYRIRLTEEKWTWINEVALISFYPEKEGWEMLGTWKSGAKGKRSHELPAMARSRFYQDWLPGNLSDLLHRKAAMPPEIPWSNLVKIGSLDLLEDPISEREKEVLVLIADGYSTGEIAQELFISATTVVTHRKKLLAKFNARNTAELIKKACKLFYFQ
ncbi:MAG: helix-turn-helix transcriptional regulator [Lewinella sp.]|nr:helix-turn-helix transcriptional regulator [Lewinella sp.]